MEMASRLSLYSLSCLGLVEPGAAEELAFSPDHAEAHTIKSFGVVLEAPGYPRARSPQPLSASSRSGVSEARTISSSLIKRLSSVSFSTGVSQQKSREVVCYYFNFILYHEPSCGKGKFEIS